ncbi:MAG: nucleotidyltransferase family protein [Bacteroidota bacterium]
MLLKTIHTKSEIISRKIFNIKPLSLEIGVILLAAGESRRLGTPKQLLKLLDKTLVARASEAILQTEIDKVVVVTGESAEEVKLALTSYQVDIVYNKDWKSGMGSSIKKGTHALLQKYPDIQALLICLCDQPFLNSNYLKKVIEQYMKTEKLIIASYYNDKASVPALFDHSLFGKLLQLQGEEGARKIIRGNSRIVEHIPFPEGKYDIDTIEAWEKVQALFEHKNE